MADRDRPADWYPDPVTAGVVRYWDGRSWTDTVAWGGRVWQDGTPIDEVERVERSATASVIAAYLSDAVERDVVESAVADRLVRDLRRGLDGAGEPVTPQAGPAPPVPSAPSPAAPPVDDRPPALHTEFPAPSPATSAQPAAPFAAPPATAPVAATGPVPTGPVGPIATTRASEPPTRAAPPAALPAEPGRFATWWREVRSTLRSDLALHGLAYLGVLLLFAGVTGLITFSFGDVDPWVRSVAEFLVPTSLFLSSWYLARRGAGFVAGALALAGGAILPIVVAASLTDGAPFPPDAQGRAVPITQGIAVAAVAVAMGLVARRTPSSPLRFVAAPALWMAAGLAAGVVRDPVPAGYETAQPDSIQLAVVLAAVAGTLAACSWSRVPETLSRATRLLALPIAAVVALIEVVLAADEGWPVVGTVIVAIAALALTELGRVRLGAVVGPLVQYAVVVVTAGRLSAVIAPEWIAVGTAVALMVVVEHVGRRGSADRVVTVGLALTAVALSVTLVDPWTRAVGFGLLAVWGLWRYVRPADWLPEPDRYGLVPAMGSVIAASSWWETSAPGAAMIGSAGAVLAVAVAGRVRPRLADDPLWRWFVPASAALVIVASAMFPWGDHSADVAITAAVSALALVMSALPVGATAWATATASAWSLANVAEVLDVDRDVQAAVLAAAALVVLAAGLLSSRPVSVHLAAIGHAGSLGALAATTWPGWSAATVVGGAAVGWVAVTLVDQRRGAPHLDALRNAISTADDPYQPTQTEWSSVVGHLPPIASIAGAWATVYLATDAVGWVALDDPWATTIAAGVLAIAAAVVRIVPWRTAGRSVLAWITMTGSIAATMVAISAAGADRGNWAPVATLGLGVVVAGLAARPWPPGFTWIAWSHGLAFVVYGLDRIGLDRDWADVAVAGVGAATLLGGLAAQRHRHGALIPKALVIDRSLLPPIVLGAVAFSIGGILGLGDGTGTEVGWTAVGMAAVVFAVARLLPLGALVAPAEILATVAYTLLAPWEPDERPWTYVPWAGLLLVAAATTRRPGNWTPARWDLPSFLVAHLVAVLALVTAVDNDAIAATAAGFGLLSVAIAVALRRWEWAVGGAVLVLAGGFDAGPGWLALALLVEGVALTVTGMMRTGITRSVLIGLGTLAIIGAWFDLVGWLDWSTSAVFFTTVPAAAVLTLGAAAGLRLRRVPDELAGTWAIAMPLVATSTTAGMLGAVDRLAGGLTLAGSLLVLTAAAGVVALRSPIARLVAALPATGAWLSAAWAFDASATATVLVGTAIALLSTALALVVHRRWPRAVWLPAGGVFAVLAQLAAAVVAIGELPDRVPVIVVLLAMSAELALLGVLSGRTEPHVASPIAAGLAWLVEAIGAAADDTDWRIFFGAVPVGAVVVLTAAAALRFRDVRRAPAATWAATGATAVFGTAAIGLDDVDRLPGGLIVAGSLLITAGATALVAEVTGQWARWTSAALAAAAWAPLAWAVDASAGVTTLVGTGVALAALAAGLFIDGRYPESVWRLPVTVYAAVVQVGAALAAIGALPDRELLIAVLLAVSAESVAIGTVTRRAEVVVAAPVSACAAWLLYAEDALSGEPIWFTVPIGLTLLVIVGEIRWIRRGRGGDPAALHLVAIEFAGMSFLVAAPLVRTLVGHLWQGVIAIAIGVLIATWGAATKVRWRAAFGVATVVLAVALLLGVPLSRSVTWRGPTLWVTLTVAGIVAIVVAAGLERNRRRIGEAIERLDRLTTDWERLVLPIHHRHHGDPTH